MNATKVCQATESRMNELFDGFVVVGFVAGTNEPCIIRNKDADAKTTMALEVLLSHALSGTNPAETDGQ